MDKTRAKIIKESRQLVDSVQLAVCQLKKYNTKQSRIMFDEFQKLLNDEKHNQKQARELQDCEQLFKMLEHYKLGVSKEIFDNLTDRVVYAMQAK